MAFLQVNYLSKALFRTVPINVILPVDKIDGSTFSYSMEDGYRFKTLYLLHGLLGSSIDWVNGTRIQRWAEEKNLAVVMPSGDNSFYVNSHIEKNDYSTFIGEELVEITRKMFPLSDRPEDTFIAGLSMGGYGAITNGIRYSGTFSHIAGLSSAIHMFYKEFEHQSIEESVFDGLDRAAKTADNPEVALKELLDSKRPVPKFYMACGTDDGLFDANVKFRDFLVAKGCDVTWYEGEGGHDWDFWDSQIKRVLEWLPLDEDNGGLGSGHVSFKEDN